MITFALATVFAFVSGARYLDATESAVEAYSRAEIANYIADVKSRGVTEHGFPRLAVSMVALVMNGRCLELRDIAVEAMTLACENAAKPMAPNLGGGNNFSIQELVKAIAEAEERRAFEPEVVKRWRAAITKCDTNQIYSHLPSPGDSEGMNWAIFAAVSEQIRIRHGMGGDREFVDFWIADQSRFFDANGMWKDPGCPIVYDLVPRLQFAILLDNGYDGACREKLEQMMARSAEPTLKMLSANGQIPYGGRSNMFLHNQTLYAALCEWYAKRARERGDALQEWRFRYAAERAMDEMDRWLDEKPIKHVKNRYPTIRTGIGTNDNPGMGCEEYAYFNKYMITMASWANRAREFVKPEREEFRTSDDFHWLFRTAGEYSAQYDYQANEHYDATGLGRFERRGAPEAIALSSPCAPEPAYQIEGQNDGGLVLGAEGMKWELSENGLWMSLENGGILVIPVFTFDGSEKTEISASEKLIEIRYRGHYCRYRTNGKFRDTGKVYSNRSGRYRRFEAVGEKGLEVTGIIK